MKREITKRNKHNGMRPQDIVVSLKIICLKDKSWNYVELANALLLSVGEISNSLERSAIAGLVNPEKTQVNRLALREFLIYGLKYVFPPQIGASARGIPTAHSASPVKEKIAESTENFVWKYYKGTRRGSTILPLYAKIPQFIENDRELYELLAVVDTLRIGKSREKEIAIEELDKKLNATNYTSENAPICRKTYRDIIVDFMPVNPDILGFSNHWYKAGYENRVETTLPDRTAIYILPVEYYVATKLEALNSRGGSDIRGSHDWEDIVYVLDNCDYFLSSLQECKNEVLLNYLRNQFNKLLNNSNVREIIYSALPYNSEAEQIDKILEIMKQIVI